MFDQWTSKASVLVSVICFISAILPLRCLGAIQYEQTCHFPDQSVAAGYAPCNVSTNGTQTSASACCPDNGYSYCTDSGLCYENGLLSRGGCTDVTWTSPSCPSLCSNVVKHAYVNLFNCHRPSLFQCGTGDGPGDCLVNFTIQNQNIVLRNDQQPGAQNAVNFTDPSATFITKSSISTPTAAPITSNATASETTDTGPSVTAVGLGVGLPLGFLLLVSLGVIIWQERRIQQTKRSAPKIDQADLLRAAQAASTRDRVGGPGPYHWRGGEMPTDGRPPGTTGSANLRVPDRARSVDRNGSGSSSDEVHELFSPMAVEPSRGV